MIIKKNSSFEGIKNSCSLSVFAHGYAVTDEKWRQDAIQSPWSRIYYVASGSGVFVLDGKEIPIEPGYAYFAPCGVSYGFYGKEPLTKLFFHVNVIMPDGYDLFSSPDLEITRFSRGKDEMSSIFSRYASHDPKSHVLIESELWRIVAQAATELLDGNRHNLRHSETVTEAIAFIRNNLSANLKTGTVADAVFCSVGNLNDHFHKEIGTTVAKYIDDLLMFEAHKMLASGNKTVGEVSAALGYCDQFYFSRRFTKHFSITPREYKKLKAYS